MCSANSISINGIILSQMKFIFHSFLIDVIIICSRFALKFKLKNFLCNVFNEITKIEYTKIFYFEVTIIVFKWQ